MAHCPGARRSYAGPTNVGWPGLVGLGVSLGVACFPEDGETSEELLSAAARRMQTDRNGRKTVLTVAGAGLASIDMMT